MSKNSEKIDNKSQVLLDSLAPFYEKNKNKKILFSVTEGESKISLRVLDWFVSNYSKKNDTTYELKNGLFFNVYFQYKARLKSFSKKFFDPFRRGEKITLRHDNFVLVTTVGQLNFFKWCIEHGILKWVEKNIDVIEKDMNNSQKKNKGTEPQDDKVKRKQLSQSVLKTMNKKSIPITVNFN